MERNLNTFIETLKVGEVTLVAGAPCSGKTILACNVAIEYGIRRGKKIALFFPEMKWEMLEKKLIRIHAGISTEKYHSGKLDRDEVNAFRSARKQLRESPIYISDGTCITAAYILAQCRELKEEIGGLDLIIIDGLELVGDEDERFLNQLERNARTYSKIKGGASDMGVSVLVTYTIYPYSGTHKEATLPQEAGPLWMLNVLAEEGQYPQSILAAERGEDRGKSIRLFSNLDQGHVWEDQAHTVGHRKD